MSFLTLQSSPLWGPFFLAAGVSNISQAFFFHYSKNPNWSASTLLGQLGKKPKPPHGPTWAVVGIAGLAYGAHGYGLMNKSNNNNFQGLHYGFILLFASLKFGVASKLGKIVKVGRPGALTNFIGKR